MSRLSLNNLYRQLPQSPVTLCLLAILIGGLLIRIWGTWFGLPYLLHNDEGFEVIRALQLGNGDFNFDRIGKGGYFYVLFVEFGVLFVLFKTLGVVSSANDFAQLFVTDPTAFYLVGRITTAIIGTTTVYLAYRIGARAYSDRAGLIAAAILAVSTLHVSLSHYITVDVPMVFLATLSLLFAIRLAHEGRQKDYFWAAGFAAMATATKIPAIVLVLPLFIAHCYVVFGQEGHLRATFQKGALWLAAGLFLVVYVSMAPGIIVNFGVFSAEMLGKFGGSSDPVSVPGEAPLSAAQAEFSLFRFYAEKVWAGIGIPAFILGLAGTIYGLWARRAADIILISFAIVMFVAIALTSDTHHFFPRYALPTFPVLALMGGRLADHLMGRFATQQHPALQLIIVTAICAVPLVQSAKASYLMTREDTRVLAKRWIDDNIPHGSKVFIEGTTTRPYPATVPLSNSAENIRASIEHFRATEPGKARYFQFELKADRGATFDLMPVSFSDLGTLTQYKDAGVEYLVLRPGVRAEFRLQEGWPEFIAHVKADADIVLIKTFTPTPDETPGPVIEVYKVNSGARQSDIGPREVQHSAVDQR